VPGYDVALALGAAILIYLVKLYEAEPTRFWQYAPLIIVSISAIFAGVSAIIASRSLDLTRDTVRPFLTFGGTINLGDTTLAFPITNTGSMPADDVSVMIDPFGVDEDIGLETASEKCAKFSDEAIEDPQEAVILFPNQTWQAVLNVDLTNESDRKLRDGLLSGDVRLRITIAYSSFRRKHETVQTSAFDELSLSRDGKQFHGMSIKPQKWS